MYSMCPRMGLVDSVNWAWQSLRIAAWLFKMLSKLVVLIDLGSLDIIRYRCWESMCPWVEFMGSTNLAHKWRRKRDVPQKSHFHRYTSLCSYFTQLLLLPIKKSKYIGLIEHILHPLTPAQGFAYSS